MANWIERAAVLAWPLQGRRAGCSYQPIRRRTKGVPLSISPADEPPCGPFRAAPFHEASGHFRAHGEAREGEFRKGPYTYVLDDGGAFGVGIADSLQRRAQELGVKVVGRDRLDPKEPDYKTVLTKIKGLNPDALYYGGVMQAAAKLAPQAYEVMPRAIKAGSDGVYDLSWPKQSGKEAVEGWFCSQASPELVTAPKVEAWVTKFKSDMKRDPTNYAITAYNAVHVIADAVERTAKAGKPLTRTNLRDAIQATKVGSIQGPIAFDANGDILTKTVSIYQWRDGEIKYVAVAPEK